jgi:hypothetical protein
MGHNSWAQVNSGHLRHPRCILEDVALTEAESEAADTASLAIATPQSSLALAMLLRL